MERGPDVTSEIAEACAQYRPTYVPGYTGPDEGTDQARCETCEYWGNGKCGAYKRALGGMKPGGIR